MHKNTIEHLKLYVDNSFNIFPVKEKDKTLSFKWQYLQKTKQTKQDVKNLFLPFHQKEQDVNIAIVTGDISNLIVIDVDYRNGGDHTHFIKYDTYTVRTWSGGYHFYFRYTDKIPSSRKNLKGIFEGVDIKGNGGIVFAPPSVMTVGDKTGEYRIITKNTDIQPFPQELIDAIQKQDEERASPTKTFAIGNIDITFPTGERPGDAYNRLEKWERILEPLGWKKSHTRDCVTFWTRPGKKSGISASTNYKDSDLLYLFTSTDAHLDQKAYTKFSAYTFIHHDGDFHASALAIIKKFNL